MLGLITTIAIILIGFFVIKFVIKKIKGKGSNSKKK